jgi:peptide/nickel transport system substrate-binding protein
MFRFIKRVFKAYDTKDIVLSGFSVIVFLLMILKMIVFPYGMFGFGESNIYTEAMISRNGFQSLNPLFVDYNESDREASRLIFSGLMKYDPQKRAIVDDMASLVISADKLEYNLTLKDNIKWHDGKLLTTEDVYFTYHDLIMNPSFSNQILKANFNGVKIEILDTKTVKFILEKPNSFFISNLIIGILPKHKLLSVDPYNLLIDDFNKKPVGSGPFMVKEPIEMFNDGHMQVTLYKNPDYYAEQSEVEVIRLISYLSMDDLLQNINSINSVVKISGAFVDGFKNNTRFEVIDYELPQYTAVFMNMESEYLKSKNVRLALQKSVDKNELLSEFVDKKPVDTPLMELDQSAWVYQSNKEEANGLLKESGFLYAESDTEKTGFRFNSDSKALELRLIARLYNSGTSQYEDMQKVINYLNESFEEIGVDLVVEFLFDDEFEERITRRDYDLLLIGQSMGYNLDTYAFWHSSQASPSGLNFSNYKSFAVDSLIADIRSSFDSERRQNKLTELAKQISEDVPAIFLYRPVYFYAYDKKISGISLDSVVFASDRYSNMVNWEFSK